MSWPSRPLLSAVTSCFFQIRFSGEQAELALGQVAGYQVGIGGSDEAHCYICLAPGEVAQLCCGAQHDADIGVAGVQLLHGGDDEVAGHGVGCGYAHHA